MTTAAISVDKRPRIVRAGVLVLFAAIVAIAGTFSLSPLDRDESRFAQATAQMLETGDFINIRFQDSERNKKPVGIYWLQAASVSLLSKVEAREIWAYRIPSFLAALLSAWLAYWAGCRLFDEETAFLGALLLIAAPSFSGEATIAKTDAVLLTTVLGTQLALARLYLVGLRGNQRVGLGTVLMFWIALAAGILIKGPITPMIAFFTIVVLALVHFRAGVRQLFDWFLSFRPVTGLVILLALVGPWMIAIGLETEGRFFSDAIGTDMLGKVSQSQENHSGALGYYAVVVWFMFWPAALFLPLGLQIAVKNLRHPGIIFALAWLIPTWLVFEFASTKLPHYTLPLYPALALIVAFAVTQISRSDGPPKYQIARLAGSALYLAVAALVAVLIIYAGDRFSAARTGLPEYLFALPILAGSCLSLWLLWQCRLKSSLVSSSLLGALTAWILYQGALPRLDYFQMSPAISTTLKQNGRHPLHDNAPPVALLGYYEPSVIFLVGTNTISASPQSAAAWLMAESGHVAVVEGRYQEAFVAALADTPVQKLATLTGYNYSNGIDVVLTLYISE